jgi:hypothetical protein
MMELRSQRLKEQAIEEEMKQQGMQDLAKGISSGVSALGSGLTKGMEQNKLDTLANQLGAQTPGWQGGGAKEIELRKAMGQYSTADSAQAAIQQRFQQSQDMQMRRWEAGQDTAAQQRDYQRSRDVSQDARQAQKDALGFRTDIKNALVKMADPNITPDEHSAQADLIHSIYNSADQQKLPLEKVTIPTYMSPDERSALKDYQETRAQGGRPYVQSIQELQKTPGTGITPGPAYAPVPGETLPALQGAPQPQQQPSPAASGGGGGTVHGTAIGPGGNRVKWVSYDGGKTKYQE